MDNDKDLGFGFPEEMDEADVERDPQRAPRARNRTVMLTPEVTGEVRSRIARELHGGVPLQGLPEAKGLPPEFGGKVGFSVPTNNQGAAASSAGEERGAGRLGGFIARANAGGERDRKNTASLRREAEESASRPVSAPKPVSTPVPVSVSGDCVVWNKEGRLVGFLVSFDNDKNGEVFPLRVGRLIVTSEPAATGNFLVIDHDTVSPMHAILRMAPDGAMQVLDQLSEYGTRVRRAVGKEEEKLSGDKTELGHGDRVWFGERSFAVCLIAYEDD